MSVVINHLQQRFNKLFILLKANGSNTNRNRRREADKRTEGADCTTRSNKACFAIGNKHSELCQNDTQRQINGCRKEEGYRSSIRSCKELLQHGGTCKETRSKERRISFFPLFLFSNFNFLIILQAIDDICFQINPILLGAVFK